VDAVEFFVRRNVVCRYLVCGIDVGGAGEEARADGQCIADGGCAFVGTKEASCNGSSNRANASRNQKGASVERRPLLKIADCSRRMRQELTSPLRC
jgi:hypothetical protein